MSDQVPIFTEIGEVITARAKTLGLSMSKVRQSMIEHGGPTSADPVMTLYAGHGTVRNATARALADALGTTWLSITDEASALLTARRKQMGIVEKPADMLDTVNISRIPDVKITPYQPGGFTPHKQNIVLRFWDFIRRTK